MTDENENTNELGEEENSTPVDRAAEMAAAMEAEGIPVESNADYTSEEKDSAPVDHAAEMAAAMEAEGIPVESNADYTAEEKDSAPVDRGAEMAAAMEAAGVTVENDADSTTAESIAKTVSGQDVNIEALLKVPVSLAIEVGRTQMSINELLETQEGSVIELERLLEEPLDILVNGALIAHGVVVLANNRFGLQITDIISLEERARSL